MQVLELGMRHNASIEKSSEHDAILDASFHKSTFTQARHGFQEF